MKTCPVARKCGACQYINVPYEEQLKKKEKYVQDLFHGMKTEPIISMKDPYHYRHKIYASFTHNREGKISCGLYQESTHKVVNSEMCLIQNVSANKILHDICTIATKMHLTAYSERSGMGILRHAYLRISHQTGDVLLVIVIASKELPGSHAFVSKLTSLHPEIKTIILNYNHDHTSMILGKREKALYGPGYIEDSINHITFRISSRSFYQVNPVQTERLYAEALKLAELKESDEVLDLCCGVGTITLCAAEKAGHVTGVEINEQAVHDAILNARHNNIANVDFIAQDAEEFMYEYNGHPDAVFLDPPRAGFSASFMHALGHLSPRRIIYISCNPETQSRDTAVIYHDGYQVRKIIPVDMFPFTDSVENIVLLTKRH